MSASVYSINKGVNRSVQFQGLTGQYIWYFCAMVVLLLAGFSLLYGCGAGMILSLVLTTAAGLAGGVKLFALSRKYGEHGLLKAWARRKVPSVLKSYSRSIFIKKETKL